MQHEAFHTLLLKSFNASSRNASNAYNKCLHLFGSGLDHVAFRTFDRGQFTLTTIEPRVLAMGYRPLGDYRFPEKHVRARAFVNHESSVPRIFLSELLVDEMSTPVKAVIDEIVKRTHDHVDIPWGRRPWPRMSYDEYKTLYDASDYATWVAANGLLPNHLTVQIADEFSIDNVVKGIRNLGFSIAVSGGTIKGNRDVMLEQASTLADVVRYRTEDDVVVNIPTAYCEFAKRWPDPKTGRLFDGFVEGSANYIFESTDVKKHERALVVVKPDAVKRNITNRVLTAFLDEGLDIVNLKRTSLTLTQANTLYEQHASRDFYADLVEFMLSGEVVLVEVRGRNCVTSVRKVVERLRKEYGTSIRENVVHGSDSIQAGEREAAYFFR